jgi:hypothetical protein
MVERLLMLSEREMTVAQLHERGGDRILVATALAKRKRALVLGDRADVVAVLGAASRR